MENIFVYLLLSPLAIVAVYSLIISIPDTVRELINPESERRSKAAIKGWKTRRTRSNRKPLRKSAPKKLEAIRSNRQVPIKYGNQTVGFITL